MKSQTWMRWGRVLLGLLAAASLVLEFGFPIGERWRDDLHGLDIAIAGLFALELIVSLVTTRGRALARRWYEYVLLLLFVAAIGALRWFSATRDMTPLLDPLQLKSVTKLYLMVVQVYVVVGLALGFLRGQERFLTRDVRPERLFAGGFALLIVMGTLALLMPRSASDLAHPLSLLDALFTATSAVCVTGLAVRDTGLDLSPLGQSIVLGLFQVGGLGIAAFVGWLSIVSGRGFSVPQNIAMRELVNARSLSDVRRHVATIVLFAIAIELAGMALLYGSAAAFTESTLERLFWALFHSVSAFCNAGFSLQSDSLQSFRGNLGVNGTIAALVVLGGLGPMVVRDLGRWLARWRPRRRTTLRDLASDTPLPRLRTQTKVSLTVTATLIVLGTLGIAFTEWGGALSDGSALERVLMPFFQSVTARTAGFETVAMGTLRDTTLVLIMVLMVIGASPVSTGGGIKTVTLGVLFATMRSIITGRNIELFRRSIPVRIVRASVSIFLLYVLLATLGVFLLSATDPEIALRDRMFELISALSTVGLSTGHTAEFSTAGQLILCLTMFAGRVGPLTMVITVFRGHPAPTYSYPEEPLVLG